MRLGRRELRVLIESIINESVNSAIADGILEEFKKAEESKFPYLEVPGVFLQALGTLEAKRNEYVKQIKEIEKAMKLDKYGHTMLPTSEIEAMERFADETLDEFNIIFRAVKEINFHESLQKELFDGGAYIRHGTYLKRNNSLEAVKRFDALKKELQDYIDDAYAP